MRSAIAIAALVAAALLFMALASACACGRDSPGRACHRDRGAPAVRTASVWSLGQRFALPTLPRLGFPSVRDGAACACCDRGPLPRTGTASEAADEKDRRKPWQISASGRPAQAME